MPKPHPRASLAWLALSLFLVMPSAAAAPLDPATAVATALARHPQLEAATADLRVLSEEAVAARQLPDPKLNFGVEGLPLDRPSLTREEMTQIQIGLSQTLPGVGKRALAGALGDQAAQRSRQRLAAETRRISRAVRLAWLDVHEAEAATALAQAMVEEYDRQIDWARGAYPVGQLAQAEILALRGARASAANAVEAEQGQVRQARANLARWLGAELASQPLAELGTAGPPPDPGRLTAALESHPELAEAAADTAIALTGVELARAASRPDWSVDLVYGLRGNDRADLLKLMVGVDLPLFTAQRQDRRLAARLAEVERERARAADRRLALEAELAKALADWQSSAARLQRHETEIVPLAQRRVESTRRVYGTNQATPASLFEARRAEILARQEGLALRVGLARAQARLDYFRD